MKSVKVLHATISDNYFPRFDGVIHTQYVEYESYLITSPFLLIICLSAPPFSITKHSQLVANAYRM